MEKIIFAELISIKDSRYTIYVFKDLETNSYLMCTKLPNWQTPDITPGDKGFVLVEHVLAGQEYFNLQTQENSKYQYTNVYFKNFIKESVKVQNSEIII